jgi:hypothetical protein
MANKDFLVLSIKGHYETIAYFICQKKFQEILGVNSVKHMRFETRSLKSILHIILNLLIYRLCHTNFIFAIQRSNSRALLLLVKILFGKKFYTYSDGIGDSIVKFKLEIHPDYIGHIGAKSLLVNKKNIIPVSPFAYIEQWRKYFEYNPKSPSLVILKNDKEVYFDKVAIANLINNLIEKLSRNNKVYVTGKIDGFVFKNNPNIIDVGPITKLKKKLLISNVYGFPSTLFITFSKILPKKMIHILPSSKKEPIDGIKDIILLRNCTLRVIKEISE